MPPMLLVEVARCGSRSESDVRRARGFYARIMTPDRRVRLRREAWGFAIGSVFFAVGAVPFYAEAVGPVLTNLTFFVGAIFFTLAAFIQLALSGRRPPRRGSNRADRADWWAVGGAVRRHPLLQHEHDGAALITAVNTDTLVGSRLASRRTGVDLLPRRQCVRGGGDDGSRGALGPAGAQLALHVAQHGRIRLLRPVRDRRVRAPGDLATSSACSGRTSARSWARCASSWRRCSAGATSRWMPRRLRRPRRSRAPRRTRACGSRGSRTTRSPSARRSRCRRRCRRPTGAHPRPAARRTRPPGRRRPR